jgi:hypothetical protein
MKKLSIWIVLFLVLGLYLQGYQEPEKADMVVLSRDLFTIPSREILRTEVLYTILGGKIVY